MLLSFPPTLEMTASLQHAFFSRLDTPKTSHLEGIGQVSYQMPKPSHLAPFDMQER